MIRSPLKMRAASITVIVAVLAASAVRGDDVVEDRGPAGQQPIATEVGTLFDHRTFDRALLESPPLGTVRADAVPDVIESRLAPLRQRADARIAAVDRIVGLSDAQRKKLEIAVQSDMRRLVDAVVEARATYANRTITTDPRTGGYDEAGQKLFQEMSQDSQRCRQLMQNAFGPESLLAKVVVGTLDEPQARAYAAVMRERATCRWNAVVAAGLTAFDDQLGLTQKQHDSIAAVLVADPPPVDDEALPVPAAVVVADRLASLGDEKLATLLDPRQQKLVAAVAKGRPVAAGDDVAVAEAGVRVEAAPAVGGFRIEVR